MTNADKLKSLMEIVANKLKDDNYARIAEDDLSLSSYTPYGFRSLPMLDACFGRQGIPAGKTVEIFGFEASGKTTLALHLAATCQKMGGAVMWIDTEKTFSPYRAKQIGVNTAAPYLMIGDCDTVEAIFRTVETTVENLAKVNWENPFMFVVDSVTAGSTEYELQNEFSGEQRTGHEAKQIRAGIKRVTPMLAEAKTPLVLVNHAIKNIPKGPWAGPDSTAAGGHAIKLFGTIRIEMRPGQDITHIERGFKMREGNQVKVKVHKNKVNELRLREFDVNLLNESGFDITDNLLDALCYIGHIYKPASQSGTAPGTVYTLNAGESNERKFKRDEWKQIVNELGGTDTVYDLFYELGKSVILPYGGL